MAFTALDPDCLRAYWTLPSIVPPPCFPTSSALLAKVIIHKAETAEGGGEVGVCVVSARQGLKWRCWEYYLSLLPLLLLYSTTHFYLPF